MQEQMVGNYALLPDWRDICSHWSKVRFRDNSLSLTEVIRSHAHNAVSACLKREREVSCYSSE